MGAFLKGITPLGWIGIIILFNGTLIGGTNYLKDLFLSQIIVNAIVAFASLGNMFLGGLVTMFGSQGSIVKQVAAMPGVEPLKINASANHTLAAIAMDPSIDKVEALPSAQAQVAATAKS